MLITYAYIYFYSFKTNTFLFYISCIYVLNFESFLIVIKFSFLQFIFIFLLFLTFCSITFVLSISVNFFDLLGSIILAFYQFCIKCQLVFLYKIYKTFFSLYLFNSYLLFSFKFKTLI